MKKHIPNRANSFGREICQLGDFTYSVLGHMTNKEMIILMDMHTNSDYHSYIEVFDIYPKLHHYICTYSNTHILE